MPSLAASRFDTSLSSVERRVDVRRRVQLIT
jgi:hypothetical protein